MLRRLELSLIERFTHVVIPPIGDPLAKAGLVEYKTEPNRFSYRIWLIGGAIGLWPIPAFPWARMNCSGISNIDNSQEPVPVE